MRFKAEIMDSAAMNRAIIRIAHQIIEKNGGADDLCLIGIRTRGVPLALRIADEIFKFEGVRLPVGELDITLYRDDLSSTADAPIVNDSSIPFSIAGKTVILVDDVIYTGRTARAALEAVLKLGRAARIQLFAMVDRGHRELPIRADYIGKSIPTSHSEIISVMLSECDGETKICIFEHVS